MDNQQPSTSRGCNGGQGGGQFRGANGNGNGNGQAQRNHGGGQGYRFEPPAVPILDKVKVLEAVKPVVGFEGSVADFTFETNLCFDMKHYALIEWFVGRSAFKDNRRDQKTHRGTRHTLRALLDLSMNGPVLIQYYSVTYNGLVLESKQWGRCCVIPVQHYVAISREHRVLSSRYSRSLSVFNFRAQSKSPERSMTALKRTPSPEGNGKKCTPQEYARAILMPHGSFGLYDNFPKKYKWNPRNQMNFCHENKNDEIFIKCSPRKNKQNQPSTSGLGKKLPNPTIKAKEDNHRNSPRRLLPTVKWRHMPLRQQPQPPHLNVSPERQQPQQPAVERMSRPRQRDEYPPKPHSASPMRGPIMYNEADVHRRYSSLSPPRLPTDRTKQKGRRYCDCWKRAKCAKCAETDDTVINNLLRKGNLWYCTTLRAWYKVSAEYNRISSGIRKMNRENR